MGDRYFYIRRDNPVNVIKPSEGETTFTTAGKSQLESGILIKIPTKWKQTKIKKHRTKVKKSKRKKNCATDYFLSVKTGYY